MHWVAYVLTDIRTITNGPMGGIEIQFAAVPASAADVQRIGDEITEFLRGAGRATANEFATVLAWSPMSDAQ